ncbi:translation initiation factor IF-2-like [Apodemus sylvaticus]|uniref:translation initiation factor IF-2-like n=1 Tax=Apodemus sylvaticus TaxID=10129 RepID=UPI0022449F67|nr:translation initiation factor IF-2-like [Apodemus sylvaticus]
MSPLTLESVLACWRARAAGRAGPAPLGKGAPSRTTPALVSAAAPVVWEVSPLRSRTSSGRGGRLPSPGAPSGLAGVQARPSRAWAADRGQVQATPLPQPPAFPLGPSPPPESEAPRPPGEGAGAQAQPPPPGRPGSSRGGGGKTREPIPSARQTRASCSSRGVEGLLLCSEAGEAVLSQAPSSGNDRAGGPRTAGNILDDFPNSGCSLLWGVTLHLAGQGVQKGDTGGRAARLPEPWKPGKLMGACLIVYPSAWTTEPTQLSECRGSQVRGTAQASAETTLERLMLLETDLSC